MNLDLADIVKLYNRIETLEKKVAELERKAAAQSLADARPAFPVEISGKYKPLAQFLYENWDRKIQLTYEQIEEILGFELPNTAHNLPQSYWANTEYHAYAKSWLLLGYKAKVNDQKIVVFTRNVL